MKKANRILALLCMFLIIFPICLSFAAAEELNDPVHEDPPVDLQYIRQAKCDLAISSGTASIISIVKGAYGSTTKCEIDLSLQKKTSLGWDTVATWAKIEEYYQTSLSPSRAVISGKTYRAVAVVTVWNGNNSETTMIVTPAKSAP